MIIARLVPGMSGGIEQSTAGLVAGLGMLTDGDEEYIVITENSAPDWLDAHAGPNTKVIPAPQGPAWRGYARNVVGPLFPVLRAARRAGRTARASRHRRSEFGPYDPFLESLGGDVVHFPFQWFQATSAPSIFNPHDLQHIHYPEFFDNETVKVRDRLYRHACSECAAIEVPSQAVKADLVEQFDVPDRKILVVPRAAPTTLASAEQESDLADPREIYSLPKNFVLYPAQTWPHKNHVRLLQALAFLRDRHDVSLPLVCTGRRNEHWPKIEGAVNELGLNGQALFLGYIPAHHLRALYRLAEFTVFPTLFEGGGLPVLEAFKEESPLICSRLPVLLEHAGQAAMFVDPFSVEDIASAMLRLHRDPSLRQSLREQGQRQASGFSWRRTARVYRALYRELAARGLTDQDKVLLSEARRSNESLQAVNQ